MVFSIFDYFLQTPPPTQGLDSYSSWTCNLFQTVSYLIPSSPVTLQGISISIGSSLPFLGGRLVYMAIADLGKVLFVVIIWKVFSRLPGFF